MSDERIVLRRMAAGPNDESGEAIRFRLEGTDGREIDVECPYDLIERVVRFVVDLARDAAGRRSQQVRHSFARGERIEVDPLPVSHATLMADPEAMEIILVLRMFGFDLGFSMTPEHLSALKKELDRLLPLLGIVERGGHGHGHDHHH